MENNIGFNDRAVRIGGGVVLLALAIMKPDWPLSWLGWIGVVPVVTGIWGWCPLYSVFGIDTRSSRTSE